MLWLGLGTRFVAFSLLFLTFVATSAVHWPDMVAMWSDLLKGYSVSDQGYGNFKLPLLFCLMLLPLIFNGAGRFSLDHFLAHRFRLDAGPREISDTWSWVLSCLVLGIPLLMLIPAAGFALLAAGAALAVIGARQLRR